MNNEWQSMTRTGINAADQLRWQRAAVRTVRAGRALDEFKSGTLGHLRGVGTRERRDLLEEALGNGTEHIRFSTAFEGDPRPILEQACARGLEGLIAKRVDAPYVSTRSSAWLKLKCKKRQEFVVCGFTDRADDRNQVGSLLLGVYDNGALIPVGSVGTGWTAHAARALRKKREPHSPRSRSMERIARDSFEDDDAGVLAGGCCRTS